jgi:hypothetical protein
MTEIAFVLALVGVVAVVLECEAAAFGAFTMSLFLITKG